MTTSDLEPYSPTEEEISRAGLRGNFANPKLEEISKEINSRPGELIAIQRRVYELFGDTRDSLQTYSSASLQVGIILPDTEIPAHDKNGGDCLVNHVLRPVWIIPGKNFFGNERIYELFLDKNEEKSPEEKIGYFNSRTQLSIFELERLDSPPDIPSDAYHQNRSPDREIFPFPEENPRLEFHIGNPEVMDLLINAGGLRKVNGKEFKMLDEIIGFRPSSFGESDPHYGTRWGEEQENSYLTLRNQ